MNQKIRNLNLKSEEMNLLETGKLRDVLVNTGTLHELNRTMLHPIGMHLELNNRNMLEFYQAKGHKQIVMNKLNKVAMTLFRTFCHVAHEQRQKILGFIIQYKNMLGANNIDSEKESIVTPEKYANDLIIKEYQKYTSEVYKLILVYYEKLKDLSYEEQKNWLMENLSVAGLNSDAEIKAIEFIISMHVKGMIKDIIDYRDSFNQRRDQIDAQ